jgi:DNA-binding response OmpR family regulator
MLVNIAPTILLVEDDQNLRRILTELIESSGYPVVAVEDGLQALQAFEANRPALVILDLLLPELDGWEVCRQLRQRSNVPVMIVSALSDEAQQVTALDLGADDYLPKPVGGRVLLARIRALLRRAGVADSPIHFGGVRFDPQTNTATVAGQSVTLTPHEAALLDTLMRQPERTFSRAELLEYCWEVGFDGVDRVVDVHIASLRRKLGSDKVIRTIRGRGYRMGHEN